MKFLATDESLTITLEGAEIFFGLKHRIVIPRDNITDLQWYPDYTAEQRMWRIAGAGIPGVLYAGYFVSQRLKYYLYLQRPRGVAMLQTPVAAQNTLVITTQDYKYRQLLFTCQPDIGAGLLNWWSEIVATKTT